MSYKPLFRFLLVKPERASEVEKGPKQLASGIFLPDSGPARDDLIVARGHVIAVGPEATIVEAGDTVLYNYFAGNSLVERGDNPTGDDDVEYHFVWEEDLLGVVDDAA